MVTICGQSVSGILQISALLCSDFFRLPLSYNYFLLFSVMGVSPENFGFPPCEKDFFLHRNLLPIPSLWRATVSGPGNRPGRRNSDQNSRPGPVGRGFELTTAGPG
jgi:hypothetical protein